MFPPTGLPGPFPGMPRPPFGAPPFGVPPFGMPPPFGMMPPFGAPPFNPFASQLDETKYFSHAKLDDTFKQEFNGNDAQEGKTMSADDDSHVNMKQYISYLDTTGAIAGNEQTLGQFIYFNNNSLFATDSWYFTVNEKTTEFYKNIIGISGNNAISKYDITYFG